jgi:hypothetical protein
MNGGIFKSSVYVMLDINADYAGSRMLKCAGTSYLLAGVRDTILKLISGDLDGYVVLRSTRHKEL